MENVKLVISTEIVERQYSVEDWIQHNILNIPNWPDIYIYFGENHAFFFGDLGILQV